MRRGDLWWADLPDPTSSGPGYRRPVLVIQADAFTQSRIATVVVVPLSSNLRIASAPGNVLVSISESGLARDSVINVSQLLTLDKLLLTEYIGPLSTPTLLAVEHGIRLVLNL
jgi:mRNA interferase MazF